MFASVLNPSHPLGTLVDTDPGGAWLQTGQMCRSRATVCTRDCRLPSGWFECVYSRRVA